MKKVIYSAMFGRYDSIHPICDLPDWECFMFTNLESELLPVDSGWTFVYVNPVGFDSPIFANRWYKMHPHLLFPTHEYSVYIDANIEIDDFSFPAERVGSFIWERVKIAVTEHPLRACIYDEAEIVVQHLKDNAQSVKCHIDFLKSKSFPRNYGLFENNFIFRQHNDPDIIEFMHAWWSIINTYSHRDQLSLCYLAWVKGISIEKFFGSGISARNCPGVIFHHHLSSGGPRESRSVKLRVMLLLVKLIPVAAIRRSARAWMRQNIK